MVVDRDLPKRFQRPPKLSDGVTRLLGARLVAAGDEAVMPSENEIAAAFDVSRTVAREVVQTLVTLGLVDVSQGKRMQVRPRDQWDYMNPLLLELHEDPDEIRQILVELHQARLIIEPAVAEMAATLAADADRERLEAEVRQMRASQQDVERFVEHDVAFHAALAHATGNRVLRRIVEGTRDLLTASQRQTALVPHSVEVGIDDHARILAAILERDPARARQAMAEHLDWATRFWFGADVDVLRSGPQPDAPAGRRHEP